jgi:hypothetical protein
MNNEKKRISLYVLNDFLKFDRKLYQLFGLNLGRPIKLKTLLYFLFILVIELIVYLTPVINVLIRWFPFIFLILIPAFLAYLLSDIRTEGRNSITFFRSYIHYHLRKSEKVTYCKGRLIAKPADYRLIGYSTLGVNKNDKEVFHPRLVKLKVTTCTSNFVDENQDYNLKEESY